MTQKELSDNLSALLKASNELPIKQVIANAVQLGMRYREEQIQEGIKIVFDTLHGKKVQNSIL